MTLQDRPEAGVRTAQVEKGNVEESARHILWSDFSVLRDGVRLRQLPARPDMDDRLNYGITLLVHESEGCALVGHGEGELTLIHKANLLNLGGIIYIVEEDRLAKDAGALS